MKIDVKSYLRFYYLALGIIIVIFSLPACVERKDKVPTSVTDSIEQRREVVRVDVPIDSSIYKLAKRLNNNKNPVEEKEVPITPEDIERANAAVQELNEIYPSVPYLFNNFIDIGRSESEVIKIQGRPELKTNKMIDNIYYEIWWYLNSTIYFFNSKVDSWDNESNNLKIIDHSFYNAEAIKNSTANCYYLIYEKEQTQIEMAQVFSKIRNK